MLKPNLPSSGAPKARQRGASMIELLVSILIFAFGMLGLVGLQTRTLAYGQTSLYRSQATALTDDILDRMRADRANAKANAWDSPTTDLATSITGTSIAKTDLWGRRRFAYPINHKLEGVYVVFEIATPRRVCSPR